MESAKLVRGMALGRRLSSTESLWGIGMVLAGVPVFYLWRGKRLTPGV